MSSSAPRPHSSGAHAGATASRIVLWCLSPAVISARLMDQYPGLLPWHIVSRLFDYGGRKLLGRGRACPQLKDRSESRSGTGRAIRRETKVPETEASRSHNLSPKSNTTATKADHRVQHPAVQPVQRVSYQMHSVSKQQYSTRSTLCDLSESDSHRLRFFPCR